MFRHLKRTILPTLKSRYRHREARSLRSFHLGMALEGLEQRVVMATVTWANSGGGIWELGSNWSTGKVPTAADDVVISLGAAGTVQVTQPGDVAKSLTMNANSALQLDNGGTFQLGNGTSSIAGGAGANGTFTGGIIIVPGATMTVLSGANITVNNAQIDDQGTLGLGSGDAITMMGSQTSPGVFEVTGIMTASSVTFTGGSYTGVDVFQGGQFTAMSDTFAVAGVFIDEGAVINNTSLTNNDFTATVLSIASTEVPLVTNNKQFGEVDLYDGELASGTSLELTAMGTVTASTLFYRFVNDYTVSAGATLTFDPNLKVVLSYPTTSGIGGSTLTDNGLVTFNKGDSVSLYTYPQSPNDITGRVVVNGLMNATGTSFSNIQTMPASDPTQFLVNPGGHFTGTGNSFSVSDVYFSQGSILNMGDLTGNDFLQTVVSLPSVYVPMITNNLEFGEVDLFGGTLTTGQNLELTAMGTVSAANLFYVFTGNYTINAGASLTFDPNLRINLSGGTTATSATPPPTAGTLTDNGTLTFGMGDLFTLNTTAPMNSNVYPTAQILVGGVMNSTGASFVNQPGSAQTLIDVNSGGHLIASNSYFAPSTTSLADGSILNSGDLTNNYFSNTILSLPAIDVPLVTNNKQFSEVDLLGGTLASGVNLPLTAMGTVLTSTLFYAFVGPYTISPGATITVDPNLKIYNENGTLTDNGTLNFGRNDSVFVGTGLMVGGVLNAPGTSFNGSLIDVNSGGDFTTVGAQLNVGNLTLSPGSAASITISAFNNVIMTIDSSTTETITGNNFTNIRNNGVVATGDANAQISLTGNYWGTDDTTMIEAKIMDHHVDATLPTIVFQPFVTGTAAIFASNATTTYSSAAQNVTLTASVVGVTGTISEGTVTFSIYQGPTLIGTAQTTNESNGMASVNYALPAGLAVGSYSVQAQYSGTANYLPAIDTSHVLTVTQASTTTAGPSTTPSVPYNGKSDQTVPLTATVTSGAGAVSEGTVTFTVTNGTTQIGNAVVVAVNNSTASGSFTLPAGTPGGTYSVSVAFNGSNDYAASTGTAFNLTVTPAASTTAASPASATFSTKSQTVTLTANVSSGAGTVNEGMVTFTLLSGASAVGTPVSANVANGVATATYTLPAGAAAGSDIISAVFNGTADYGTSTDTSQSLTIAKLGTTSLSNPTTASFDTATQTISLTANISSTSGPVNEGTATFTIFSGATAIGTAATGNVVGGVATASYSLPGDLAPGTAYTIQVNFNGSGDYLASTDSSGILTIKQATPVVAASTTAGVYNPQSESIPVQATVLNMGTPVNDGTVTFQVFSGTTAVSSPVTVSLVNGTATGTVTLPGGTMVETSDTVLASFSGTTDYAPGSASASITLNQATPTTSWQAPANIIYGQLLSATQLDATASVPGTFTYKPASGTLLSAGSAQTLSATFAPTDSTDYTSATASTTINVIPATLGFSGLSASQTVGFGQAGITVSGRLTAPTAIPVGASVVIVISSPNAAVASTATVNSDGSFSQVLGVSSLPIGTYTIKYGFLGNNNFTTAFDGSTTLTVTRATQTITTFDPPASAVVGVTFHVDLASNFGLPVTLTATNATVVASPSGGYNVTLVSGSLNAVLTATQGGNASVAPATAVVKVVTAVKAQAQVILSSLGIYYDGLPHTVGASTLPNGLTTSVTYTLNGVAVAAPVGIGSYVATATINDANYQGTATSQVVIVPYVAPVQPITPVVGPVSLLSLEYSTNKQKALSTITLNFSGALNAASAQNLGNYRLATAGSGGSFDAKNAKTYGLKSATYNATTHTVTLTVGKPFKISQALELRVYGSAGRGLVDSLGRLIDGKHQGVFGGDENAIIRKTGATV